ncbi:hypothetical protein DSCO28_12950 [Desulfosarcina ovata subsp. sediminis]|uniref:Uncharacterized protein n=1 Tax=Desulfosarcina ovata subsp. sediminis TaxID=885957 RepID=A0A5K7ZM34_9BACT|nr:hypothetical protein DSCO28_12950 [Desulfosarcina ovata subsp. sediminis]
MNTADGEKPAVTAISATPDADGDKSQFPEQEVAGDRLNKIPDPKPFAFKELMV